MEQVKQTAIDWLIEQWPILESQLPPQLIEQAKEMEKEQIIEAHGDKKRTKSNSGSCVTYAYTFTGEMYYNETFKSE
jgi:hypothetical protein